MFFIVTITLQEAKSMESILGILYNLFEGADLFAVLESIQGSSAEYNISSVIDVVGSFFGGLFN